MKKTDIYSGRTRFADDIVAEFWMPKKPSRKAIILCDGCPTVPAKREVGEFFAKKGYWVFHMRYRGSWESGGKFLEFSPEEDVLLVAEGLNAGFLDIYEGIEYLLDITDITVVGASFGGAAAILSLKYPLINRAIALSPMIDWKAKSLDEPYETFLYTIEEGFGAAYRPHKDAWKRLKTGTFYSPKAEAKFIDTEKLFVVHAMDDRVIPSAPLKKFATAKKWKPFILKTGGHFSTRKVMQPDIWKKVNIFLKSK